MTVDQIIPIFNFLQIGLLVKLFLVVLAVFYAVFVVVVYRQIGLMTQILRSKDSVVIKSIAVLQIVAAGVLVFLILLLA